MPPTDGVVFAPDPASASVRGGWLPDLPRLARTVGNALARGARAAQAVGGSAAAVLRRDG
ncbi:hypothetical protein AB0H57_19620 [Micromonospora sp. NPDC050686]|uniref:hypothetical protein n=1 Tax=Micromonospora sp. NPDC050686 TaxID=3154631 RepID=UPI0034078D68